MTMGGEIRKFLLMVEVSNSATSTDGATLPPAQVRCTKHTRRYLVDAYLSRHHRASTYTDGAVAGSQEQSRVSLPGGIILSPSPVR